MFSQVLDIAAGCFNSVNDLLHFFVHVLGLDHQHNMHDRDNYLHIVWANLTAGMYSFYESFDIWCQMHERSLLRRSFGKIASISAAEALTKKKKKVHFYFFIT